MMGYCGIDKCEVHLQDDCHYCPRKDHGYTCLYFNEHAVMDIEISNVHHTGTFPGVTTKDKLNGWRDAVNDPPDENARYLCYDKRQGLQMVVEWFYNFEQNRWDWFTDKMHPTHWKELPEVPVED